MKAWKFFSDTSLRVVIALAVILLAACKSGKEKDQQELPAPEWTAERPVIDVESLKDDIDLNMDISQLNISELEVLRNAFAARQGYIFMDAELRSIFSETTWYNQRMMDRWEAEESALWNEDEDADAESPEVSPITYTAEEKAFIKKIEDREKELLANNFKMDEGWLVNVDNVVNLYQKEGLGWETHNISDDAVTLRSAPVTNGQALRSKLAQNGFAIVDGTYDQLFQVYENNDYHNFPNFVTTDLYLQAFHTYFDALLRKVEETHFVPQLTELCKAMHGEMLNLARTSQNEELRKRAEHAAAYFAIGHTLLTGSQTLSVPADLAEEVNTELAQIDALDDSFSDFLDYKESYFMYSLFRPRGHYTRTETLKRYFTAMMWLQTAPFGTDKPKQMQEAALIGQVLRTNKSLASTYDNLIKPIDYLMGQPDNGNVLQVYDLLKKENKTVEDLIGSTQNQKAFQKKLEKLLAKQVRIQPKFKASSTYKINFMPQRFQPDGLVLQEMVDYVNKPTLRPLPSGLDVMAVMGMPAAERILLEELEEGKNWSEYEPTLKKTKKLAGPDTWDKTVCNEWLKCISTLQAEKYETPKPEGKHPNYFMLTEAWDKKNLNAALASWAELKHDAILYAKQPMGAECGGGGPEEPVMKGYVEPNVKFWQAAIKLLNETDEVMERFGLTTEDTERYNENLKEMAELFLAISQKELKGEKLSVEEYRELEYVGASFENLTLDMLRNPDDWISEWESVQGADKKIALVADVYTANAFNNPEKSVLYEAIGLADEIYVIVEIEGRLYLTRGAVFSYREFNRPLQEPRLTDEEWQKVLKKYPLRGVPSWMEPLKVPNKDIPADNELVFYSSGC